MILDALEYSVNISYVKAHLDARPGWKFSEEVGVLSIASGVPIIIVSHYIGELFGYTEEITSKIKRDMLFYSVVSVRNTKQEITNESV